MTLARAGLGGTGRQPDCSGLGSQRVVRLALLIQPRQLGLPTHRCGFDMRQERVRPHVPHTCRWVGEVVGGGQAGRALGVHSLERRTERCGLPRGHVCPHPRQLGWWEWNAVQGARLGSGILLFRDGGEKGNEGREKMVSGAREPALRAFPQVGVEVVMYNS